MEKEITSEDIKAVEDLQDGALVLELDYPITFEGKDIKFIDFRKLEDMTANDLMDINTMYYQLGGGGQVYIEANLLWALLAVQHASNLPLEALKSIKIKDSVRLKNRVARFFYNLE